MTNITQTSHSSNFSAFSMNAISDRLNVALLIGCESQERVSSGRRSARPARQPEVIHDRLLGQAHAANGSAGEDRLLRRIGSALSTRAVPVKTWTRPYWIEGALSGLLTAGIACQLMLAVSRTGQGELALMFEEGPMFTCATCGVGRELLVERLGIAKLQPTRLFASLIVMASCTVVLHVV